MKQAYVIGGVTIAVIGLGIILFTQDAKNNQFRVSEDKNLAAAGQEFSNQGRDHIKPGQQHAAYNSNPPTSGPHYAEAEGWGVYNNPIPDEAAVHNLEHGGIWISYKDVDEQTKISLEKVARANGGILLSPRPANDSKIALASWTRVEKLDSYDEAKILEFIKANKNKSPEPIAP